MKEIVITANGSSSQYWRDLWRYRELLYFLAWRDLLVRYKQTVVGIAWAVLRPLLAIVIFTFVFGRLAKMPSNGAPYPILVLAALLPWQFFSSALADSGASLVNNSNLIAKVYFPRLFIPATAVVTAFVDLLISGVMMALLMWWYQYVPTWRVLTLPFFALLALAAATAAGLWISALTVKFRDFRIIIPFVVQFGFFISPVGYDSSAVPAEWRALYSFNPLVGIIDGFRWALLRDPAGFLLPGLILSVLVIAILLITGFLFFRRIEREVADII